MALLWLASAETNDDIFRWTVLSEKVVAQKFGQVLRQGSNPVSSYDWIEPVAPPDFMTTFGPRQQQSDDVGNQNENEVHVFGHLVVEMGDGKKDNTHTNKS